MRPALLDNISHQALRLDPAPSRALGDDQPVLPTVPSEFRLLQAFCPIVFQTGTGELPFQPVALMSLSGTGNLFLGPQGWEVPHLPWALARQPLMVGRDAAQWVVHIDLDSPRLSESQGEPLFLPQGGLSPLLEQRISVLQALHEGLQTLPAFIDTLLRLELLEPMALDLPLPEGGTRRIGGFHVIHEERLDALPGAVVADLHERGYWLPLAMAVASLSRFGELVQREQRLS
ncbi:MAG TPA: SapC family protein [Burkholderiaceae bacterium]|nr:SapC family protein [Burkholderiaceae bacterium]